MKKADNVIKLYKELMSGITVEDSKLPSLQENPEQYRKFCSFANEMYSNPFFLELQNHLIRKQLEKTVIEARDYEATQFGRAIVVGVLLWNEVFKTYSDEFESKFLTPEEGFNPNKIFN